MNITDEQRKKMWEELSEVITARHGKKLPYEKTIKQFAKETNISESKAKKFLREQEKEGNLISRWIIDTDGITRKAYCPVQIELQKEQTKNQ